MTRQENKAATRARILKIATDLFHQRGFRRTTMRIIAKVSGYSTGAIFASWPSKDDLWREVTGREPPDLCS